MDRNIENKDTIDKGQVIISANSKKIIAMKFIIKILLVVMMICNASFLFAQEKTEGVTDSIKQAGDKAVTAIAANNQPVEMAGMMRSNGKIYIVVAVCLTILIGLFLYVWNIDRKIGKIEKEG